MIVAAVLIGLALALFAGAFFSRRRFGLLGLALTAGATLSTLWSYDAGLVIASTGLVPVGPITNAVSLSLVVLLPAIVLLFHGYKYKAAFSRIIGSLLFTILALAFLIEPIGFALPLEGTSAYLYEQAIYYKDVVISIGVILAIIDLFFTKPAHVAEKNNKKK
ncbi:MAG: conserved rane protein of unknown function [Candidatus Saccharibacteria bacterium]|nr:conserved rane protein of unknown function [Candidatus Saccharibacteria bacterium]MDB5180764.1 conserved rane protein of unknown function [Candidatus Saccharibacteria bacterium]MDB5180815.1 conserved rane protein of unknown function [Candidatus Saccharibacteria bacterium]